MDIDFTITNRSALLKALTFVVALFVCMCGYASAATFDKSNDKSGGLAIKIEGTRAHFAVGTSVGVSATITNNTNSVVYLNERFLILRVPAEIEGPYANENSIWWAYLPAADHGQNQELDYKATLPLKPGGTTSAFWLVDPRSNLSDKPREKPKLKPNPWTALKNLYEDLSVELNFLLFSPGGYTLTVLANYWDNPGPPFKDLPKITVESLNVDVAAPQSVILFGAAVGGLIAYIILPQTRRGLTMTTSQIHRYVAYGWTVLKVIIGVLGAMLLSAIVTILLSRVAESQFLIRVTVSDFWGAIAIGFIANYLGTEILNKIIKQPGSTKGAGTNPTT